MSTEAQAAQVTLTAKLVAEPVNFTYRGPDTQKGTGMLGQLVSRMAPSEAGSEGHKTLSLTVAELTYVDTGEESSKWAKSKDSVHFTDSLITQWKTVMADPETEAAVHKFHKTLDGLLVEASKKDTITVDDVKAIVGAMRPVNLGMVHKLQLVVTLIQPEKFPQASLGKDGMYHRTIRSAVAYRRFDNSQLEDLSGALQKIYDDARKSVAVVKRGDAYYRHFAVKTVTERGRTRRILTTVREDGSDVGLAEADFDE